MAKYKVRHGLVQFIAERDGQQVHEVAFRGQVVDIPKDQAERLKEYGAIVAEDEDLARPGTMLPLPETATDEEIRTWVLGATDAEVREVAERRPMLADRIGAAHAAVKEDLKNQAEHLGQAKETAEKAAKEAEKKEEENEGGSTPTTATEQQRELDEAAAVADRVVQGSNSDVSKHLSENPTHAQAIMEAEVRRAEAAGEEPRQGVRRAVEAAAGHAGQ